MAESNFLPDPADGQYGQDVHSRSLCGGTADSAPLKGSSGFAADAIGVDTATFITTKRAGTTAVLQWN
jgi:hypothetical protein